MAEQIVFDENSEESFDDYKEKISKEIELSENQGYEFLVDCHEEVYVPDRVKLPDGRIFDDSELAAILKSSPTTELVKALRLFDLYFAEGLEDERHNSRSFLSDEEMEETFKKYQPAIFLKNTKSPEYHY